MKQVTLKTPFLILIVLDYGAVIQKLLVKDKHGNWVNVVIGLDFPDDYFYDDRFLGACIGRYAGCISNGGFTLDRTEYLLHHEKGVHSLGGKKGFGKKTWTIETVDHGHKPWVRLSYISPHLEEGYPGNLKTTVTYQLINSTLHITFEAISDRTTVVDITNKTYFRFDNSSTVDDYQLQLACPAMVETLANQLPTGRVVTVGGTPLDFLNGHRIGEVRFNTPLVIDPETKIAAKVSSPKSGITMEIITDQPVLTVHTPNDFPAIGLNCQNYPDAPNYAHFPSSVLRPGEIYRNKSRFIFDLI